MTLPLPGAPATVIFDAEFLKEIANDGVDQMVDKVTPVAKQGLNAAVELSTATVGPIVKETIKAQVATHLSPLLVPVANKAIDLSIDSTASAVKNSAEPAINLSVDKSSDVAKNVLKKGVNSSADSTAPIFSKIGSSNKC